MRYLSFAICFCLVFLLCSCGNPNGTPIPVNPKAAASSPAPAELIDGIGIIVLIDVSGSMESSVNNEQGQAEAKLAIAKRSVIQIAQSIDKYCKDHPDKNVQLGVATFSDSTSVVFPIAKLDLPSATTAIEGIQIGGGTQIGDAMLVGKQLLDSSKLRQTHIITVTDGENGGGADPATVAAQFKKLDLPPSLYLIGFDVDAAVYKPVKDAGAQIFAAANGADLQKSLTFIFEKKILAEKEE